MSKKYYLGIDQGTTGTTALLLDEEWNQVGRGYKEHTQYYPQPGWVEHDAMEIWDRLRESVEMGLGDAGITMDDIKCMGLDNQGETVVLWDN
ncbi:MAG: FGGY family carbohydrate kinase, partial [Eubacterium sp.]